MELLTESVAVARRAGDPAHIASTLRTLGAAAARTPTSPGRRWSCCTRRCELSHELNERPGLTESLETVSAVAARSGDPQTGALLIGAAGALRAAAGGDPPARRGRRGCSAIVADLREALGDDGFAAAEAEGSELDLADAVARALALSAR